MNFSAVILAAGKGTRMNSNLPKVVHKVAGKPIIQHVIDALRDAGSEENILVLGFARDTVKASLDGGKDLKIAIQEEQLGTGHALMQARPLLPKGGTIVVTNGDTPLLKGETLRALLRFHWASATEATVMTAELENPTGYGRVIRTEGGFFDRIVEEKDATPAEKQVREVNSGTYCFEVDSVCAALNEVTNNNAQKEYYLPDVLKILRQKRKPIGVYSASGAEDEIKGVNDHIQQAEAERILKLRKNRSLMAGGVTIVDPETTYIEAAVSIEPDTMILPGTFIKGATKIAQGSIIGPYTQLQDCTVGAHAKITFSCVENKTVAPGEEIGPYANIKGDK